MLGPVVGSRVYELTTVYCSPIRRAMGSSFLSFPGGARRRYIEVACGQHAAASDVPVGRLRRNRGPTPVFQRLAFTSAGSERGRPILRHLCRSRSAARRGEAGEALVRGRRETIDGVTRPTHQPSKPRESSALGVTEGVGRSDGRQRDAMKAVFTAPSGGGYDGPSAIRCAEYPALKCLKVALSSATGGARQHGADR
jgi:hypothetical protein